MLGSTTAARVSEGHRSCTGCSMERRLAYIYSQAPAYVALPPCVCAVYLLPLSSRKSVRKWTGQVL